MAEHPYWTWFVIVCLAVITVIARGFFFMASHDFKLPRWAERGLQYAPIAAIAAVVAPETFMLQGQFIQTWQDPRVWSAMAGAAWFFWRGGVLGTMVCGMLVYLPLRLGLGW